ILRELDAEAASQPLARERLREPAEQALVALLDDVGPAVEAAVRAGDYRRAFAAAAAFAPAVDRFFNEVFVMVEDSALRTARLQLLAALGRTILTLADLSELAAGGES
ncbi:MAG TPA: DALR anticodon-binding domain-containing protein, partial [Vicinamibacterales bacterium]|nr:DALR anticodon-binding domain-containing protein [Vicinamibacterales bacterium]